MAIKVVAGSATETTTGVDGGLDVPFTITIGGLEHDGEVTLVKDHEGEWWSWGSLDHWLDGRTVGFLRDLHGDEREDAICEIRSATSESASRFEVETEEFEDEHDRYLGSDC